MFWKKKNKSFTERVDDFCGIKPASMFSDISYYDPIIPNRLIGLQPHEKPENPDWYLKKWEICLSGKSTSKYAIKCDGLLIKSGNWCGSDDVPASFFSVDDARDAMYSLVKSDIDKIDHCNREGETVETWP